MHIPWRAVLLFTGGYGLFLFFAIYFVALSFFILIIGAGVSWLTVKDCLFLSTSGDISYFCNGTAVFLHATIYRINHECSILNIRGLKSIEVGISGYL
jgi:hypothetical protein